MSPDLSPERPRTRLLVPGLILAALASLLAVVGFVVFSGDSPEDTTQIDLVRQHLQAEATRFGQRDFSDAAIHGRGMPGSQALTQSRTDRHRLQRTTSGSDHHVQHRRPGHALGAGAAAIGLSACGGSTNTASGLAKPGALFSEPDVLTSTNGRLEVTLKAEAGTVPHGDGTRFAYTYNGTSPGPTLRVRPGDTLVIKLENNLDEPTNLHTHGLHVSPEGDSDNVFVQVDPGASHTYT